MVSAWDTRMKAAGFSILPLMLAGALGLNFPSQPIKAQALDTIFTQETTGSIYNLNSTTGASDLLGTYTNGANPFFWNGAAYDSANGLMYVADIGTTNYVANTTITNNMYSFNPANPGAGVNLIGQISASALTGAGWHNGDYYTIASGSSQLVAYDLAGHTGGGTINALPNAITLGNLGTGVVGLSLGDLDFIGNTVYISAGTVDSQGNISTTYTLYSYTITSPTTATQNFAIAESTLPNGAVGVGIGFDSSTGQLVLIDNRNNSSGLDYIDPTTGAITVGSDMSGPDSGGPGDYTTISPVPEPSSYAVISLALLLALIASQRFFLALRPARNKSAVLI